MAVQVKLSGVKQLSNTSLTSIVEFTNFNIGLIASAVQDFLRSINYVEGEDEVSVEIASIDSDVVQIKQKLSVLGTQLNNSGAYDEVIRLEPSGSVIAKNVLANDVLQGLRVRLKVFGQVPPVGVPGEIIYIQEQPGYEEGFYGYLISRGWVCLSCGDSDGGPGGNCCCNKENIIYTNAGNTSGNGALITNNLSIGLIPALGTGFMFFVNGMQIEIGDGTKNAPVYLSDDNGANAISFYQASPNSKFYWNASYGGFDLDTNDRITMRYIAIDPTCGTGTTTTTTTMAPISTTTTTAGPSTTTTTVFVTSTTIPCAADTIVHIVDPSNPTSRVTFTGTPIGPFQVQFIDAYGTVHYLTSLGNIIMPWVFDLSNPYYSSVPTINGVYRFTEVATGCVYVKQVGPSTTTTSTSTSTTSTSTSTTTTSTTTLGTTTTTSTTTTTLAPDPTTTSTSTSTTSTTMDLNTTTTTAATTSTTSGIVNSLQIRVSTDFVFGSPLSANLWYAFSPTYVPTQPYPAELNWTQLGTTFSANLCNSYTVAADIPNPQTGQYYFAVRTPNNSEIYNTTGVDSVNACAGGNHAYVHAYSYDSIGTPAGSYAHFRIINNATLPLSTTTTTTTTSTSTTSTTVPTTTTTTAATTSTTSGMVDGLQIRVSTDFSFGIPNQAAVWYAFKPTYDVTQPYPLGLTWTQLGTVGSAALCNSYSVFGHITNPPVGSIYIQARSADGTKLYSTNAINVGTACAGGGATLYTQGYGYSGGSLLGAFLHLRIQNASLVDGPPLSTTTTSTSTTSTTAAPPNPTTTSTLATTTTSTTQLGPQGLCCEVTVTPEDAQLSEFNTVIFTYRDVNNVIQQAYIQNSTQLPSTTYYCVKQAVSLEILTAADPIPVNTSTFVVTSTVCNNDTVCLPDNELTTTTTLGTTTSTTINDTTTTSTTAAPPNPTTTTTLGTTTSTTINDTTTTSTTAAPPPTSTTTSTSTTSTTTAPQYSTESVIFQYSLHHQCPCEVNIEVYLDTQAQAISYNNTLRLCSAVLIKSILFQQVAPGTIVRVGTTTNGTTSYRNVLTNGSNIGQFTSGCITCECTPFICESGCMEYEIIAETPDENGTSATINYFNCNTGQFAILSLGIGSPYTICACDEIAYNVFAPHGATFAINPLGPCSSPATTTTTQATTTVDEPCNCTSYVITNLQNASDSTISYTDCNTGIVSITRPGDFGIGSFSQLQSITICSQTQPTFQFLATVTPNGECCGAAQAVTVVYLQTTTTTSTTSTTTTTQPTTTTTTAPMNTTTTTVLNCTPNNCLEITVESQDEPVVIQYVNCTGQMQQATVNPNSQYSFCYCEDGGWAAISGDAAVINGPVPCELNTTTTTVAEVITTTTTVACQDCYQYTVEPLEMPVGLQWINCDGAAGEAYLVESTPYNIICAANNSVMVISGTAIVHGGEICGTTCEGVPTTTTTTSSPCIGYTLDSGVGSASIEWIDCNGIYSTYTFTGQFTICTDGSGYTVTEGSVTVNVSGPCG